jgi:glycosyltransferase involved in cell wall biosynthesis
MKILFYIFSLGGGGAERTTVNLANYWAKLGWQISIVTPAAIALDAYALDPAIERISLNLPDIGASVTGKLMRAVIRAKALRRVLVSAKPDVALGVMDTSCATLALATLGLSSALPVGWVHIHPPCDPQRPIWRLLLSITYGRLPAITTLTHETASWLRLNTFARQIEIIPNPVQWPLPDGQPRIDADSICKPGRKLLLAAGRLAPQKGFDMLLDAFAMLCDRRPDWDLAIIGEGAERQGLEAQVSKLGLGARAVLPGWAGNIAELYRRADMYVMSSRYEGFPNTLAEAMAHGLPAVSFDCETGPRDIIRDGIDGFLAPREDVPALTASLDRLMSDGELRTRFGASAQEVRDRYSLQKVTQMWESTFDGLLKQRNSIRFASLLCDGNREAFR